MSFLKHFYVMDRASRSIPQLSNTFIHSKLFRPNFIFHINLAFHSDVFHLHISDVYAK